MYCATDDKHFLPQESAPPTLSNTTVSHGLGVHRVMNNVDVSGHPFKNQNSPTLSHLIYMRFKLTRSYDQWTNVTPPAMTVECARAHAICDTGSPTKQMCVRPDKTPARIRTSCLYLYSAMNLAWKFLSKSTKCCIVSSLGRMVVLKWNVPGSCPKPEPGTVLMPVASSSLRQ